MKIVIFQFRPEWIYFFPAKEGRAKRIIIRKDELLERRNLFMHGGEELKGNSIAVECWTLIRFRCDLITLERFVTDNG